MSTDIQPVSGLRVKYVRGDTDRSEVVMFEDAQQHTGVQIQAAEADTERKFTAVRRSRSTAWTVSLGVLYLLMLAGIITRYVLVTLEKDELNNNYIQLQEQLSDIRVNNSQLQDELKSLKIKTKGKCPEGWTRFGSSCYFRSTEEKTWSDSRIYCWTKGSDLVVINSREEQVFVTELSRITESWIGLRTERDESTWKYEWTWVDGSSLTETFWETGHGNNLRDWYYASCQQGRWTYSYYDKKTWICEK